MLSQTSGGQKFPRDKVQVLAGLFPSEGSVGGGPISLPFSASRGCLYPTLCGSPLHLQSTSFYSPPHDQPAFSSSEVRSSSVSPYKNFCDYI